MSRHYREDALRWFELGFAAARDCPPDLFANYPSSDLPDDEFGELVKRFDRMFDKYYKVNCDKDPGDL